MKKQSRRYFIKTSSVAMFSLTSSLSVFTHSILINNVMAEENPPMVFNQLINALWSTNDPECESVASKLSALKDNQTSYDLHLRNADLNSDDIEQISKSIKAIYTAGGPELHSFSMSYNPNLKDKGVAVLAQNLPSTLREIGLVGCGISDKSVDALIGLAQTTPKLHWLCVENNDFSNDAKQQLLSLGQQRNGLLVIV